MRNSRTPISPGEQVALDRLTAYLDSGPSSERTSRAEAIEYLVGGELERDSADALVEQLLSKGYLYLVNDDLRALPSSNV